MNAKLNPYSGYLGDRDPVEVLRSTPAALRRGFEERKEAEIEQRPRPAAWSAAEIAIHLAETELVHYLRLRHALAESHHVIQPFDQNEWAKDFALFEWREALALFTAVRSWMLRLIAIQPPEQLEREVTHPERGSMPIRALVETFAGHDLSHLAQLERTWLDCINGEGGR